MPKEWFAFQGWPIYPEMIESSGVPCQFQGIVDQLTQSEIKRLMGNAIHLPLLFKQLLYVLSRLRPPTAVDFESDDGA